MSNLYTSPYFWGILTFVIAVLICIFCVFLLKFCYRLCLPDNYKLLKSKFGKPEKSLNIKIHRIPLPEFVWSSGIYYISLSYPDKGLIDFYKDKLIVSVGNNALCIYYNDEDFYKKLFIEPPYLTISDFKGELPSKGFPIGIEVHLTHKLEQLISRIKKETNFE